MALVVAVIAGVVGGYFLRWGTEPTKTVTKTVTNAVTETAAPEAYTTSDRVQVALSFDGARCLYSGPGELKAGSTVGVTYTSTVNRGWFIWWLAPGTTYEQLMRSHASGPSDRPSFVRGYAYGTTGFGGSNPYLSISDGDLIAIGCATHPGVVNATMLRVLPG
ncbi:MAG: hypothetical protein ACM3OO_06940 [Planctomycetaceae bacterium]